MHRAASRPNRFNQNDQSTGAQSLAFQWLALRFSRVTPISPSRVLIRGCCSRKPGVQTGNISSEKRYSATYCGCSSSPRVTAALKLS
ncbi:hypothetical protein D3C72_2083950 [compost metagenome]